MKNLKIYFILFLSVAAITACSPDPKPDGDQIDNYYFVKVGNVALPVRVCGNINSDIAIVFVHGGSGGTAQLERANIYWKEIEKYYKVVYYDQRASGFTQGNPSTSSISIEQFSEDLDNIVDFTKQIAKAPKVFIHGVSFGGALATYYLLDTAHQNKLNGAILEAPGYDFINSIPLSVQMTLPKIDSLIAIGKDVNFWNNAKQFYAAHPTMTVEDFAQHEKYVGQLGGLISNTSNVQTRNISLPKVELAVVVSNSSYASTNLSYKGQPIFSNFDLTAELNKIKLPIMLVWGEKDGILPKNNLAQKFISNVSSTDITYDPTKYLLSAHLTHIEEWQQFNVDTKAFIEAHK